MADPSQVIEYQTGFAPQIQPYASNMLGQAQALTDTSQNPYMQYMGDKFAQFTPLQQQAFQGAQGMQAAPELGQASGIAGLASQAALNYGTYQPASVNAYLAQNPNLQQFQMGNAQQVGTNSFTQPGMSQAYMSPYMQNVVDVQQREAQRASDIAGTTRQSQQTAQGAFGGARGAIMNAEAARNLANQKGDIQATGTQAAYQSGMGQFNAEQQANLQAQMANQQAGVNIGSQNLQAQLGVQQLGSGQNMQAQLANQQAQQQAQQLAEQSRQYGAGLGLQGIQTALTGAAQLGTLGQDTYQQNMGINQLQQQYGAQQQQQTQNILSDQYQQYLNNQNYPYKQLGFMSDMLKGLPLSQTSSTMYQAAPSTMSQVAGLGTAAYGLSKMAAKGGSTKDIMKRPAGLAELALARMA